VDAVAKKNLWRSFISINLVLWVELIGASFVLERMTERETGE